MSRRAVTLLLLVIDFAALVVAHSLTELSAKATILLAFIVVVVSAAARNYRVQPIWRELAVLGLAAGGADTAMKLQLGLPVHHGPMVTAAVFLVLAATAARSSMRLRPVVARATSQGIYLGDDSCRSWRRTVDDAAGRRRDPGHRCWRGVAWRGGLGGDLCVRVVHAANALVSPAGDAAQAMGQLVSPPRAARFRAAIARVRSDVSLRQPCSWALLTCRQVVQHLLHEEVGGHGCAVRIEEIPVADVVTVGPDVRSGAVGVVHTPRGVALASLLQ
jgi:hypothetical protein